MNSNSIVSSKAKIGSNVKIGPFCVVGDNVIIEDNVVLKSHVVIDGYTKIGEGSVVFPFASLGNEPQDISYRGEKTELIIGKNCKIRENVQINTGTIKDKGITKIGNDCLLMSCVHVGHDCDIGDNVILSSGAILGGHVKIEKNAIIGGIVAVQHKVKIGRNSMIGGFMAITEHVPPYSIINRNKTSYVAGANIVGMKRKGINKDTILSLNDFFKNNYLELIKDKSFFEKRKDIKEFAEIFEFIEKNNTKSMIV